MNQEPIQLPTDDQDQQNHLQGESSPSLEENQPFNSSQEAIKVGGQGELDLSLIAEKEETSTQNPVSRSNLIANNFNINQLDQELNQEGDHHSVVQNTDWFTLARKLRQHNRELVKTVVQLEQALADTQETLQNHLSHSKNTEAVLHQQTEELNHAQQQVSRLFYELEASHQTAQRQQNLLDQLTTQLQEAQESKAQLERDCALLQESYNEQAHQLIKAEKEIKNLRELLHLKTQENLTQTAPPPLLDNPITVNFAEILAKKKQAELDQELDNNLIKKLDDLEDNSPLELEAIDLEESSAQTVTNHQPIKPWSSQGQPLPFPAQLRGGLEPPFVLEEKQGTPLTNPSELNQELSAKIEEKPEELNLFNPQINLSQETNPEPQDKKEINQGMVIKFPVAAPALNNNPKFPSFDLKSSFSESSLTTEMGVNQENLESVNPQSFDLKEDLKTQEDQRESPLNSPSETPKSRKSKPHLLLPLELPKTDATASPFMRTITFNGVKTSSGDRPNPQSQVPLMGLQNQEVRTKSSISPLIYPYTQNKKKSSRSIKLPNFS